MSDAVKENKVPLLVIAGGLTLFPGIRLTIAFGNEGDKKIIDDAMVSPGKGGKNCVGVVASRPDAGFYTVGVLAAVMNKQETQDGAYIVELETLKEDGPRFEIVGQTLNADGNIIAEFNLYEDEPMKDADEELKVRACFMVLKRLAADYLDSSVELTDAEMQDRENFQQMIYNLFTDALIAKFEKKLSRANRALYAFMAYCARQFELSLAFQQEMLEIKNMVKRAFKTLKQFEQISLAEQEKKRALDEYTAMIKEQERREVLTYLKNWTERQIGAQQNLQNMLNGRPGQKSRQKNYGEKYEELKDKLPEAARQEVEKILDQLNAEQHPSDKAKMENYLDYVLNRIPWGEETEDNPDLNSVKSVLDEDHDGLEKIKTRILEFLAVKKLNPKAKGSILCFVGPPGVGKTSLGRSIARALGRNFIRMSIGGVRDEAEIRGHHRTYVGAIPGRVIEEIIKAGSMNPVFMIDEIDKVGRESAQGNPEAALLEMLDPEQNNAFTDHYLGIPVDLSRVLFICTGNLEKPIHPALRDRMEIIRLAGYTENEKISITEKYLIPKQIKETGVPEIDFTRPAVKKIIREYTAEAGVRNLERAVGSVLRPIAKKIAGGEEYPKRIDSEAVSEFLGAPQYKEETAGITAPGVVAGLAWTEIGGTILMVEAKIVKGDGKISYTGKLGDDFKESIKLSQTLMREDYPDIDFNEKLVHINAPDDAEKDGPSAGLAVNIATRSFLDNKPVKPYLGMTGKICLERKVLAIGGVKEKMLAAARSGLKEVILPKENEDDWNEEVPQEIKKELTPHFVETIEEAMKIAFPS